MTPAKGLLIISGDLADEVDRLQRVDRLTPEAMNDAVCRALARAHAEGKAEGRREMAEEAARLCDEAAAANVGGESMDEGWHAKMWGALTTQAEKLSDRIRSLVSAAPLHAGEEGK